MQTALSILCRAAKQRWIFLIIACCCSVSLQAQDIIYANGNPNPPFTFPAVIVGGPALNVTISPVKAAAKPPVTMTITNLSVDDGVGETNICSPCAGAQSVHGITFQAIGDKVTMTGVPLPVAIGKIIRFTIVASVNGEICQRSYTLNFERAPRPPRKPIDLGIALDRSGNMRLKYDGSSTTDHTLSRFAGQIRGLHVLSAQLDAVRIPGDKIAVQLCTSDAELTFSPPPFNGGLIDMEGNVTLLQTIYNTHEPRARNALADGILRLAFKMIPGTTGNNKAMIVFSDGLQRRGFMTDTVQTVGPDAFIRTGNGHKLRGDNNEIKIYTISLGTNNPGAVLMQGIGNANGGAFVNQHLQTTFETEAHFAIMFTRHLANILSGDSLEFVNVRNGKFPIAQYGSLPSSPIITDSFSVRKGINTVTVTLFTPNQYEPEVTSVKAGGKELIQYAVKTKGDGFVTLAFHTSFKDELITRFNGDWKVQTRLSTSPGIEVPYKLMILVDGNTP
ncbi:hypothetical protein AAHN97_00630 [Chitinophaga niabensis]|uniref:vWA domain-containing protein n=1 Tax=Chitinophaga niabensis TaxID=536979 RepID=UPI0031B9DAA7